MDLELGSGKQILWIEPDTTQYDFNARQETFCKGVLSVSFINIDKSFFNSSLLTDFDA